VSSDPNGAAPSGGCRTMHAVGTQAATLVQPVGHQVLACWLPTKSVRIDWRQHRFMIYGKGGPYGARSKRRVVPLLPSPCPPRTATTFADGHDPHPPRVLRSLISPPLHFVVNSKTTLGDECCSEMGISHDGD